MLCSPTLSHWVQTWTQGAKKIIGPFRSLFSNWNNSKMYYRRKRWTARRSTSSTCDMVIISSALTVTTEILKWHNGWIIVEQTFSNFEFSVTLRRHQPSCWERFSRRPSAFYNGYRLCTSSTYVHGNGHFVKEIIKSADQFTRGLQKWVNT